MSGVLHLAHGDLATPAFLPDATYGVVRAVDAEDLERCGVPAVVMSTFHLMQHPGSSTVRALGGLHNMTGWRGPIVTDSGAVVVKVLEKQEASTAELAKTRDTLRSELLSNRKNQFYASYMNKAKDRMRITINRETLAQVVA